MMNFVHKKMRARASKIQISMTKIATVLLPKNSVSRHAQGVFEAYPSYEMYNIFNSQIWSNAKNRNQKTFLHLYYALTFILKCHLCWSLSVPIQPGRYLSQTNDQSSRRP